MTTYNWIRRKKPTADGHAFFQNHDGRWAVADNSGSVPETTDDGVLWLDSSRPIEVSGTGSIHVPLRRDEGTECFTIASEEEVAFLRTIVMFAENKTKTRHKSDDVVYSGKETTNMMTTTDNKNSNVELQQKIEVALAKARAAWASIAEAQAVVRGQADAPLPNVLESLDVLGNAMSRMADAGNYLHVALRRVMPKPLTGEGGAR